MTMPETPQPRLLPLAALLPELEADAARRYDAHTTGIPAGPVTGLPRLDTVLGGSLGVGINVLHGGPGAGKTALALQVAATTGCPALYVTAEMAPVELLRRLIARTTRTFLGRMKTGELAPQDVRRLAEAAITACPDLYMLDCSQAAAPIVYLKDLVEVVRGSAQHLLLVVDSVHAWAEAALPTEEEYQRLNGAVSGLNSLALAEDVSVLALAERNRASAKTGGLAASAGSRAFEYRATAVLDLDRADEAKESADGWMPVTLKLSKNRNGSVGTTVKLQFSGRLQTFREASQ